MNDMLNDIDVWLKESAAKESHDMGSDGTTHPSASVDDQDKPAQTGSRAAENESDVKADVPGDSVNEASANGADGAGVGENAPAVDIGTKAAPTGEDSANETASVDSGRADPGTAHPANMAHGEKYSSLLAMGDEILADIVISQAAGEVEKPAAAAVAAPAATAPEAKPEGAEKAAMEGETDEAKKDEAKKDEAKKDESEAKKDETSEEYKAMEAKKAGAETAEALVSAVSTPKIQPQEVITEVVKNAQASAAEVCDFLDGYEKNAQMGGGEEALEAASEVAGAEAVPAEAAAAGAVPAEAAAAGAVPEEAALAGAEGVEGAEGGDLAQIAEALAAAGVTPEDLMAAAGGGAGAEAGAEAGADLGGAEAEAISAEELAAAAGEPKVASTQKWAELSKDEMVTKIKDVLLAQTK